MPFDGAGAHVLMLAANADQHIAKQAASLSCAGYRVSTLAFKAVGYPDPVPGPGALHQQIFHMPDMAHLLELPHLVEPMLVDLFSAPIHVLQSRATVQERILRDLRWVFRLRRIATVLHWSARVRRARTQAFRARRQQAHDVLRAGRDGPIRLNMTAQYASQAAAFSGQDPGFQARLDDLGPPRVVHAHDLYTLAAGAVLADRYGAKLVYDAHEYEPERTPVLPEAERDLITLFEDRILGRAAGLQTVSQSIAELYRQRFGHLRVNLAMNCPALRAAGSDVPNLRERAGLDQDVPLAVFVGLPELEGRGLGVVLQAMTHLPDLHLAVIGPRWEKQDAELTTAVQAAGLAARVHLLDPVAPGDVITAIRDADLSFCLMQDTSLNHRFAMPNKLFESLLAGVPVLVADLPDMGGLVLRLRAGLVVDQTDVDAVVAAIRQIRADRAGFVPQGDGRTAVEAACSWEGQEQALLAFYSDLLSKDVRGSAPEESA
jgi:glycosyltransferase involved in cell wall biosynthesis